MRQFGHARSEYRRSPLPLLSRAWGNPASRVSPAEARTRQAEAGRERRGTLRANGKRGAVRGEIPVGPARADSAMAKYEEKLNIELARLLGELDLAAEGEQQVGGNAIDVAVEVDGLRIAIEAKRDFKQRPKAVDAVDRRFRQDLAMLGVALCYPDGATVEELDGEQLTWTVRTREAWVAGRAVAAADWQIGGVGDLAESLRQAPGSVADADKAAQVLSRGLDDAVQSLTTAQRRTLAERLDLPGDNAKGKKKTTEYFTAAKRGMLLLAMAMLFHHRLHEHLPESPPDGWNAKEYGAWPPLNPTECARDHELIAERLDEAWRTILLVDYRPVFESALVGLAALGGTERANHAVFGLAKCVIRVAAVARGLRHDLLGRIFHRVLDTARYDGSFYTSTAAATLLAGLAIREEDCDWSDVNEIAKLRICDPACGTGTLLMAAAERIHQLRRASGAKGDEDEALLALHLVEDVLWGYDINLTATHMAASALGMLSPKTQFNRMRVFRTFLGVDNEEGFVGSLELLGGQLRLLGWPGQPQSPHQVDEGAAINPPVMSAVIMNPPYTRASLRHQQFTVAENQMLKQREKDLFASHEFGASASRSGTSTQFLVLADQLIDSASGMLAVVLPAVIPTAPSGQGIRKFLATRYHVEMVISSHDPERIYMSENTNIGEILLLCRRWPTGDAKPPTTFVNLGRNPGTASEALALRDQIIAGETGAFTLQRVEPSVIESGDWTAMNFFNPFLVGAYQQITPPPPPPVHKFEFCSPHRQIRWRYHRRPFVNVCATAFGRGGRTRRAGAKRPHCLHAFRHPDSIWTSRLVASQDRRHAIYAGSRGFVHRTEAVAAKDG